ncbi:MAG: ABC transporter substrate-binding protein [Oscillospiraceae bacterium]|nr:ABC transporter substrate-binding protein [Oscillospiraceae bacterium]
MKRSLALVLVLLLLFGCTPSEPSESPVEDVPQTTTPLANGICRVAYFRERTVNPLTTRVGANLALFRLVYEGLFELTETFEAVPILCDTYEQNGNVWTFTLRGVTFSDGTALTAQDVVHSFTLAQAPASAYAGRFSNIESFRALGESAVEVVTRAPNAELPALLDIPIIKESDAAVALGTGRYQFLYEDGQEVLLRAPQHAEVALPYDRIEICAVGSEEQLAKELQNGAVSIAAVDITATGSVSWGGNCDRLDYPTTTMQYIGFNTARKALRSSNVRRAIACAIDREAVAGNDYSGFADAATLPIHPNSAKTIKTIEPQLAYSPETATANLSAAGREELSVSLLVNNENPSKVSAAQRIAESLKTANITATVETVSWEEFVARLTAKDFDLYLGEVALSADFDVTSLIAPGGALNYGGFVSESLSQAIYAARAEGKREEFLRGFVEEVPFAPVLFKRETLLVQKHFFEEMTPAVHNPFYHFYDWKRVS